MVFLWGVISWKKLVMNLFDKKWESLLGSIGIDTWLNIRYVDDGRTILQPLLPGWRWVDDKVVFCTKWQKEDRNLSPESITKRVLLGTLNHVETFLRFTIESEEDFEDGWLPTLDTCLRVNKETNQVEFKFFEKPEASKKTVQRSTAMEENSKFKILSNDLMRRFFNTMEEIDQPEKWTIIDQYGQKLLNSGYSLDQVRKISVNGIKGHESRKIRYTKQGRPFRRTGKQSKPSRVTKKLQQKSSGFKKSGQEDCYVGGKKPSRGNDKKKPKEPAKTAPKKTCIFVEYTHQGALAKKLREVAQRLEHILGFGIKVVEKAGLPLISKFPTDAWDNTPCGREDCITCTHGAEQIPPCAKKSAIYENVCSKCNKGAGSKEPVVQTNIEIPSIYVGETSRSIKERGGEHIAAYRSSNKDSHIFKHQSMEHPGEEPEFILRVASFHKTALERQVGEAVRIKRRGGQGAVLNSKAEFDRCRIPRLVLEEQDLEQADKLELERGEQLAATLDKEHNNWEQTRIRNRTMEHLEMMKTKEQYNYKTKRTKELPKREGKTRKRRRIFTIIGEDLGAAEECNLDIREDQLQLDPELHNNMEQPPTPPHTTPAVLELPKTPPSPSPPKVTHSFPLPRFKRPPRTPSAPQKPPRYPPPPPISRRNLSQQRQGSRDLEGAGRGGAQSCQHWDWQRGERECHYHWQAGHLHQELACVKAQMKYHLRSHQKQSQNHHLYLLDKIGTSS